MTLKPLQILGDDSIPCITLNADEGIISMGGVSLPENSKEVFGPVINWVKKYIKTNPNATKVSFFFDYLNTASTKMVFDICYLIDKLYMQGENTSIIWHYSRDDHEMRELGEEIMENYSFKAEIKPVDNLIM